MLGYLLPETDAVEIALRLFIDFLGMLAAIAAGRSFASSWSPVALILPSSLALAAGLHFLHYSLFAEDPQSGLYYYVVIWIATLVFAAFGYRAKRALQMGSQYRWLFHTEGMFWTHRPQA
jgi:hypothetical protein